MNNKPDDNELLLSWMANGTLDQQEQARVAKYLQDNPEQQQEIEFLQALRKGVSEQQHGSPGAFGLRRLQNAIQQEKQTKESALSTQPAANDNNWWKASVAAAALVILVQGGLLLNTFTGTDQEIQPLGVEPLAALVLQIEFEPDATEGQIRALLGSVNGRLIDGPSAVGIYRLQIDQDNLASAEINRLISELEAASGVIKYVEQN